VLLVVTLLYFNSLIKIFLDHFIIYPLLNSDIVFLTYCGENNYFVWLFYIHRFCYAFRHNVYLDA
jgi:hypothetical protein